MLFHLIGAIRWQLAKSKRRQIVFAGVRGRRHEKGPSLMVQRVTGRCQPTGGNTNATNQNVDEPNLSASAIRKHTPADILSVATVKHGQPEPTT